MITIYYGVIKWSRSRKDKFNFTMKENTSMIRRLGWNIQQDPAAGMILNVWKSFETREDAVQGKKEFEEKVKGFLLTKVKYDS